MHETVNFIFDAQAIKIQAVCVSNEVL